MMMVVPAPSASAGPGFGAGWSAAARPVRAPHGGPFVIAVGRPLMEAQRSVESLRRVLVAGVPLLVLLTTVAAWFLIGRTLRPVHAMSRGASRIADATTGERLDVPPTRDEVATLALTLNGMLDRIADGTRRQREFVSDASHELKSPIAALRTLLEVEHAHPGGTEPKKLHAALLAETSRLETLTADLLALARLDEATPPRREELDFDDVVLEEAARPRRVPVDTRGVIASKVRGDRQSLLHLVRNLLDNAARHAATRVDVSTHAEGNSTVLWIDDDGPGIPEADRVRVFERFTRSGSGRSRDTGGAGLGLAVVERVARQHGGSALATEAPGGGARLEVRLPA
jgi:signal transduction histidine kinase